MPFNNTACIRRVHYGCFCTSFLRAGSSVSRDLFYLHIQSSPFVLAFYVTFIQRPIYMVAFKHLKVNCFLIVLCEGYKVILFYILCK